MSSEIKRADERASQIAIAVKDLIETLMLWNGQASAGLDVKFLAGLRDELAAIATPTPTVAADAAASSDERRPAKFHCQNGGDVCLAGNRDGVCCPEDSCDIDDGTRKNPLSEAQPDERAAFYRKALYQIAYWLDDGNNSGQNKVQKFALSVLDGEPALPALVTLTNGMDRREFHDKAWSMWHAKALNSALLPKLSIHAIRTLWDVLYDSMPRDTAPQAAVKGGERAELERLGREFKDYFGHITPEEAARVINARAAAPQAGATLTDEQISEIWNGMEGGRAGFMKQWGYLQFARALLGAHPGDTA
jgi:hypothetical protein